MEEELVGTKPVSESEDREQATEEINETTKEEKAGTSTEEIPEPEPRLNGVEVSVPMRADYLFRYNVLNFYTSFRGWFGVLLSILCLITFFAADFGSLYLRIVFLFGGLLFTVLNPIFLLVRARQQYALTPVFKRPLTYIFAKEGMQVEQGDMRETLSWDHIWKIQSGLGLLIIYTSNRAGSVLAIKELGEHREKVFQAIAEGCDLAGVKRVPAFMRRN